MSILTASSARRCARRLANIRKLAPAHNDKWPFGVHRTFAIIGEHEVDFWQTNRMSDLRTFDQIGPNDVDAVGGKGLSLALMAAAGLPVPPGFCVTTNAFRQWRGQQTSGHSELGQQIHDAYRELGAGLVAVRSSATAEDGTVTSSAGQQETILGVSGDAAVCDAVQQCWASLHSERAVAYRRRQGVSDDGVAMAVVVQRLVAAEVAGVLFTRDPMDPDGGRMLVEASWGLGESVVSGRVTPDRYAVDRETGRVTDRRLSIKAVQVTSEGSVPVPPEKQATACLDDKQLSQLADLGRQVEAFYGAPRDVEWAWADGRFWLLQARPITTADASERAKVRREEIAALTAKADARGTVWSRFNLAEILPEPTPMTWAVVRRFMSGRGGFGQMFRDLGYDPDPSLDEEGVFDLVCGRPYCNLSREPRLHYKELPFEHPFAAMKKTPQKALYPTPVINHARLGWRFWLFMPVTLPLLTLKFLKADLRRQESSKTFPTRFREEIVPAFLRDVEAGAKEILTNLEDGVLLERLKHWIQRTLYDFARDSLKPTAFAAFAMASLGQRFAKMVGPEKAKQWVRDLMMGVHGDPQTDVAQGVREVAAGRLERAEFLNRFGHRGGQEMELASPRWSEVADVSSFLPSHASNEANAEPASPWERLIAEVRMVPALQKMVKAEVDSLHLYFELRETAKNYLLMGYALIRRVLVEIDRRYRLNGGVFYLTPDELPRLTKGEDLSALIAARRRRRAIVLTLEVPQVLFSDDLEAIGRPVVVEGADTLQGVALSAGVAEAPALVLSQPLTANLPPGPYILVCPSTDPAWVPLFVNARGLVMETGGVLSHGAIVAREFGLPAVAGLGGVQRRLKTGQRLRVDGGRGTVTVLSELS
jgi:phosphohistidine swiveling domain-containing protein